ncbi:aminotransferase class V-fold PLP-dependent enzyme [Clostridium botulinum]|uniref:aminotransferase class V-fold PLP-dependent enzyme n=1 Tax=Clostridium botulinum TaxID=1491 RepID=UPI00099B4B51|nr:aminotransferase class V-fold PLP-dependent enzyme [Clostridium botulinum]MCJ8173648.1 aminotransferase class V-fold PLP-dependent enzyme [Clostridium botulinum]NFK79607.1 aminotransferase class V-fold PLP-dependent enzyme [Clostridium botulinum]OPD24587.1 class V aminotransferase [Clostridium botulinum]
MYFNKRSPYRYLVVGSDTKVPLYNGQLSPCINFDNAATTPPLASVMNAIVNFSPWYSSIHRGTGYKSQLSSKIYEDSRKTVGKFIGADLDKDVIIYVKNTTEAINKLSYRLCSCNDDSIILTTSMEHHSNDLPWRDKYNVDYIEVDDCGRLVMEDLRNKLIRYGDKVKLVTIAGASNVTGYINPIYDIAKLVHEFGCKILVDGAQLVPHCKLSMKPHDSLEHIDYLAFSAHKMYAPFGIGVLIGPKETFERGDPDYKGGGTVNVVTKDYVLWTDPPEKDEAGTPNVMGVIALAKAIDTMTGIGMKNIEIYEQDIFDYAFRKIAQIPDIKIYSCKNLDYPRVAIIPFNISGMHHSITAEILSKEFGIAVRNGCFCAQPYVQKILNIPKEEIGSYANEPMNKRPGMVRLSFGMYNDIYEIDFLVMALNKIVQNKNKYLEKYG